MSDINLHDDAPHQDWQGGEAVDLQALIQRHQERAEFPVRFSHEQLEHVFEQARAALHKDGMNWTEASRLAERVRARVMGKA